MAGKNRIVVYRKSLLELHNYKDVLKETSLSLDDLKRSDEEHHKTMELAKRLLDCDMIFRADLKKSSLEKYSQVITVGGDGTFLEASHYVEDAEMFGINSDCREGGSEGFFSCATRFNLEEKLEALNNNALKKTKLNRLQVEIDGKKIRELALNDVLVTHSIAAATSKYYLKVGDEWEEQKSSGIWISASAGSTAGIRSAGGKIMPLRSKRIQYVVREPFSGQAFKSTLKKGFVKGVLEVESKMGRGAVFIDGQYISYPFNLGQKLKTYLSQYPLVVLGFDEEKRKKYY